MDLGVSGTVSGTSALSPTVFHEPWWLEAASGGTFGEVIVESGGRLAGRLPFVVQRRARSFDVVRIPDLTHCLGPAIAAEFDPPGAVKSTKGIEICSQLIAQLPKAAHVWFRLHPETANTLAFDKAGFLSTVQWSVEIAPRPEEQLWKAMRDKTRNAIRRGGDRLTVTAWDEPGRFLDFYRDCLRRNDRRNHYDDATLAALAGEVLRRRRGRVLAAIRPDNTPEAAILTVWCKRREFYFMSARDTSAHFGAINLLIWRAIQDAAAANRIFDMDNIHVVDGALPNHLMLSGFGGNVVPRYCVSRSSALLTALQGVRRALGR
ncbi:MAG TPA: GNAT family N-acetyltransferase [Acidiphilium sp.]|uniref:GNAT family N-acetyltransferase n=1 Tax=unclassified Acidiphilium TaxID=2617493 RepID=UPI000BD7ECF7|nr:MULTISPECIES: GNAT family N-acetyltransferase [unclassified Acidiphilium]OYV57529.1 MAG: hypothetical protein B7Z76_01820 [Acidiphilium sp. 20-67-58]HQT59592.1 GNAT family N-acetyltransferase [Acidiphilium sp.]HQU10350.1 GNAT family N-acetyltransferase [Acidiphilium sp.]